MILQQKVPEMNVSRLVTKDPKKSLLAAHKADIQQKFIKHKES